MIRYTVTDRRPTGPMFHGPGEATSAAGLSKYHIANSIRGCEYAKAHGFRWIDNDYQVTADGVLVCTHSLGVMTKEHFAAAGVPVRPIDKLTWAQVSRLRGPHGYRVQRIETMMLAYARLNIGVALELKGDGREGFRIVNVAHIERIISLANTHGVRLYIKCDGTKPELVKGLGLARERGVWTRTNGGKFTAPTHPRKVTMSVPAPSPVFISARWHGGPQVPALIVMHSTVGPSKGGAARGVARFFATEQNKTSAHYVVDAAEVIQCVGDHAEAYHCGYNRGSIGVEMCDYPTKSLTRWLLPKRLRKGKADVVRHSRVTPLRWLEPYHRNMLARSANLVGDLCAAYGIPARYLTDDELLAWDDAGRPPHLGGITTHAQMSRVFHASTHWDPGAWPSRLFLNRVLARVTARKASA